MEAKMQWDHFLSRVCACMGGLLSAHHSIIRRQPSAHGWNLHIPVSCSSETRHWLVNMKSLWATHKATALKYNCAHYGIKATGYYLAFVHLTMSFYAGGIELYHTTKLRINGRIAWWQGFYIFLFYPQTLKKNKGLEDKLKKMIIHIL